MTELIITSSILIAGVLLLRTLFQHKISRRACYALWLIVLIRLVVPFSVVQSPVSIMNLLPNLSVQQSTVPDSTPHTDTTNAGTVAPEEITPDSGAVTQQEPGIPYAKIAAIVWLCGAVVTSSCFLMTNVLYYIKLRRQRRPYAVQNTRPKIYIAGMSPSPCLFGLIRPSIYLNDKAVGDAQTAAQVIAHEECHYRHLDHVWSFLRGVLLSIYWFHPLVWVAAAVSKKDCEFACDEAVVKKLGEEKRIEYGRTLVQMINVSTSPVALFSATTAMAAKNSQMKERLGILVKKQKTVVSALIAVILLAAVTAGCTLTGANINSIKNPGDITIHLTDDNGEEIPNDADTLRLPSTVQIKADFSSVSQYAKLYTYPQEGAQKTLIAEFTSNDTKSWSVPDTFDGYIQAVVIHTGDDETELFSYRAISAAKSEKPSQAGSNQTTAPTPPATTTQANTYEERITKVPQRLVQMFDLRFHDVFGNTAPKPIGTGEGSYIYESDKYPSLQLHFPAAEMDTNENPKLSAVTGAISHLTEKTENAYSLNQQKKYFGNDSISYSNALGTYQSSFMLDGFLVDCGYFENDQTGTVTTFTLIDKR